MRRWGTAAALTVAVIVGGAGCEQVTGGTPSAGNSAPTSAAPSASAADGSDVAACSDAKCEVSVGEGTAFSLPKSAGVEALKVTAVTADRVTLTGHDIGHGGSGSCVGECSVNDSNGVFTITLGDDSRATQNGLSIAVKDISGGLAILELN
jgi:hypothetical protein